MNHRILTEPTSFYKRVAKTQLRGKWPLALGGALIYIFVLNIINIIVELFMSNTVTNMLSGIYLWLIYGPITVGFVSLLMCLVRNQECGLGNCFEGFEKFGRSFALGILMIIFIALWSLLFIIPGIIAAYRYSFAPMLLVDRPELSPLECIRESKRLMKGNKGSLFVLHLTFIGWALLLAVVLEVICILVLRTDSGIYYPFIWEFASIGLLVYMKTSEMVFYEEAIKPIPNQFSGYEQGYGGGQL